MKHVRWLAALLLLCAWVADLWPQFPPFVPPPPGAGTVTFGVRGRGRHFSYSASVTNTYGWGYLPYYPPFGLPPSRVTVFNVVTPPPTVVVNPPPMIVMPPAQVIIDRGGDDELAAVPRRRPAEFDDPDRFDVFPRRQPPRNEEHAAEVPEARPPPLPGDPAGVFRPVGPEDRFRPRPKPEREPPAPVPPREPRPQPRPDDEPRDPYARRLKLATESFARQEYGRAERLFLQVTAEHPADADAHFLLAQARFALGKYREAVASIHAGMRLRPDWPTAGVRPRTLYGPNPADLAEQLERLRAALGRFPDDPVLLFLLGYQLWFDERREEARPLFERARPLAPDRTFIDRFLQAAPAQAVAANRKIP